ncbi:MAG TPA: hypothetical protein PK156_41410 [Polyangium sp.]|nr:hypothetical protein [Polyangium sp.]
METTVYIKRDNQTPVPVRLVTVRRDGNWLAFAEIRTRTGPIKLTAMASEKTVADLVQRGIAKIPPALTAAGADVFSSIAKLAQSQAARNALKQAQSVVTNPMFANVLSFIPGFGPAIATVTKASSAIKAAENLLGRARGGDPKAQKSVGVIAQAARKGSSKGSLLYAILQAADGVRRMLTSGEMEVGDVLDELQRTGAVPWTPPWSSGVGNSWAPPWDAATGSAWTPPWDASTPPGGVLQGLPPLPTPTQSAPARGPSQPAGAPPELPMPQQWTAPPSWPQQAPQWPQTQPWPNMPMQMPPGTAPPWPWYPRSTPKC